MRVAANVGLLLALAVCASANASSPVAQPEKASSTAPLLDANRFRGSKPNVIIMFADDYGWADVGHNNPEVKETVAIDALAASGITFKDFHTYPLCTPSRAQLLTGRLAPRTGVRTNFSPESLHGLPTTEHTIAELLKPAGYDTVQLGKWHLGTHPGYHPTYRGFDQSLTVPYSVDMGCMGPEGGPYYNLPQPSACPTGPNTHPDASGPSALALYNATLNCGNASAPNCNKQIAQQPLVEVDLDRNYHEYLGSYIKAHAAPGSAPFFAYMAFSHTHVPLFFDPKFANSSARKTIFADTTMEMDNTVNEIWQAVKDAGIEDNTLILMTSDNGPWAVKCDLAGSAVPYTGEYQKKLGGGSTLKDTTWEGGQRVMGLAHWPGHITPTVSHATASSLDYLPTILALAGVDLPTDRSFDGVDLAPVLFGGASKVRDFLFMSDTGGGDEDGNVTSVRYLNFKAYSRTYSQPSCTEAGTKAIPHPDYLVFDLDADPSESTPIRPGRAVMDAIWTAHHAKLLDIETTFRSNTSYASGATMVGSAPCCNAANAVCRCNPT